MEVVSFNSPAAYCIQGNTFVSRRPCVLHVISMKKLSLLMLCSVVQSADMQGLRLSWPPSRGVDALLWTHEENPLHRPPQAASG